jgi:GNAT superfamily N-acetyltransferase
MAQSSQVTPTHTAKPHIKVTHALPEHIPGIFVATRLGYGMNSLDTPCEECFTEANLQRHQEIFPQGQFVAVAENQVVAYAVTMRTHHDPYTKPLTWMEAVGDLDLQNHCPAGEWLYGVDFAVLPEFRRRGIGTKMYHARFRLVRQLNLRGFYAGGLLGGYRKYHRQMTLRDYARHVRKGEIIDSTVSMQLNRGFKAGPVIEGYADAPPPHDSAMLIVWENESLVSEDQRSFNGKNSGAEP